MAGIANTPAKVRSERYRRLCRSPDGWWQPNILSNSYIDGIESEVVQVVNIPEEIIGIIDAY